MIVEQPLASPESAIFLDREYAANPVLNTHMLNGTYTHVLWVLAYNNKFEKLI